MEACSELLIPDILEYKDDLGAVFGDDKPLYIEIGCGKGAFINGLSEQYLDKRLLAVELVPDVLMMAMEKADREERKNICFLNANAENIAAGAGLTGSCLKELRKAVDFFTAGDHVWDQKCRSC